MIFTKTHWVALWVTSHLLTHAMAGENLLRGKSYRFWTQPNYAYCTGKSDLHDLTDGRLATGPEIWRDQATVGWKVRDGAAMVEFDLGEPAVMERLRFHTVAGRAGTTWPLALHLYGSEDGERWDYLGDIVEGVRDELPNVELEQEGTAQAKAVLHWIESRPLGVTKPYRYLVMAVESGFFVFCDEVELIAGAITQPSTGVRTLFQTKGEAGVREHLASVTLTRAIRRRLRDDVESLEALAKREQAGDGIAKKLASARERIASMEPVAASSFQDTTFPLHPLQAELFAIQAEIWRKGKESEPVVIWKSHRFDALPPFHSLKNPESEETITLAGHLPDGARWSNTVWVSNRGTESVEISAFLEGKDLRQLGDLALFRSAWHDTKDGIPVHSLLEPLGETKKVTLPPGMSTRLWLSFKGQHAGSAKGLVAVRAGEEVIQRIPVEITVGRRRQPTQALSVVLWDYMDRGGLYGLNKQNMTAARELVEERFEYVPWASSRVVPKPPATAFDDQHRMTRPAEFPGLGEWLEEVVPGKPLYGIFLIGTPLFAGKKLGEPGYEERITAWIRELAKHLESRGHSPEKFVLAAVDEPHSETEDRLSLAWTRAIRDAAAGFRVMVNPTYARPDRIRYQASLTMADIVMPRSNLYQREGEPVAKYFEALQRNNRKLWFYTCEGGRPADPTRLYRKLAWLAWIRGAEGLGFWSLGDAGGASSWNEYDAKLPTGTPLFLSPSRAENAIELEALAEGIADHALLRSLETQAGDEAANAEWRAAAEALMQEIRAELGAAAYVRPSVHGAERLEEWESADARKLDAWRSRIITLLEEKP